MIVEKNRVVTFVYELKLQNVDGESIQQVEKSRPMKIVAGRGALLEPFEKRLFGLRKGDRFNFTLLSEETFGPYKPKAIIRLQKSVFIEEGSLQPADLVVGNYIPMETEEGTPFNGKIIEVSEESVVVDFNHPLAGKDLHFSGEILEVKEASDKEIILGKADYSVIK